MTDQLSNKILERIDAHQITPMPRWRFLLLRGSFLLLAALSVVIGGVAVATILFLFVDYHQHGLLGVSHSVAEILLMVPYVWIIVFVLFTLIARISITHTKKGYQYSLRNIVFVSILLSIILGSILNYLGVGKITHELLKEDVPFYNFATYDSEDAFSRPDLGRLGGVVLLVQDKNNFSIVDFDGRIWQIQLASSTSGSFVPEASSTIRMFGVLASSSNIFIANSVYEWEQ